MLVLATPVDEIPKILALNFGEFTVPLNNLIAAEKVQSTWLSYATKFFWHSINDISIDVLPLFVMENWNVAHEREEFLVSRGISGDIGSILTSTT